MENYYNRPQLSSDELCSSSLTGTVKIQAIPFLLNAVGDFINRVIGWEKKRLTFLEEG